MDTHTAPSASTSIPPQLEEYRILILLLLFTSVKKDLRSSDRGREYFTNLGLGLDMVLFILSPEKGTSKGCQDEYVGWGAWIMLRYQYTAI
jgi:hypothetical protein